MGSIPEGTTQPDKNHAQKQKVVKDASLTIIKSMVKDQFSEDVKKILDRMKRTSNGLNDNEKEAIEELIIDTMKEHLNSM